MRLSPSPRIKAYRAAAGLGPTSEMGPRRPLAPGEPTSLTCLATSEKCHKQTSVRF